jgi:outer membrane biosynthesis protein TonB
MIGSGRVGNIERFKNQKTKTNIKVKNEKGKETGEINVEVEWGSKPEKEEDSKKDVRSSKKEEAPPPKKPEEKKREEPPPSPPPTIPSLPKKPEEKKKEEAPPPPPQKKGEEDELKKKRQQARERALEEMNAEREKASKVVSKDVLKVRVIDARFYEKQDVFGQGDPYVTVAFNNKKFRTKVHNNTKSATYNEGIYKFYILILNN